MHEDELLEPHHDLSSSMRQRTGRLRFVLALPVVLVSLLSVSAGAYADLQDVDLFPRSKAEVQRALRRIEGARSDRRFSRESGEALRYLRACRYLAGVSPDVTLHAEYQTKAQAACELLVDLGQGLTHYPANAGWAPAKFQVAAEGAKNSNLSGRSRLEWPMYNTVISTMHDSDNDNLWKIGHRRWNLNPALRRTGFGHAKGIGAMWATDTSGDSRPEPDVVAWPARGHFPVKYWKGVSKYSREPAWSIHLNPRSYALPPNAVPIVRMWKLKNPPPNGGSALRRWRRGLWVDRALELHGVARLEARSVVPAGLTWLPVDAPLNKRSKYWVEIEGLVDPDTKQPKDLGYYVLGY